MIIFKWFDQDRFTFGIFLFLREGRGRGVVEMRAPEGEPKM